MNGIFASNLAKEGWEITQQAIEEWTRRHNPTAWSPSATAATDGKSCFFALARCCAPWWPE
jgi:hypothetical protein